MGKSKDFPISFTYYGRYIKLFHISGGKCRSPQVGDEKKVFGERQHSNGWLTDAEKKSKKVTAVAEKSIAAINPLLYLCASNRGKYD